MFLWFGAIVKIGCKLQNLLTDNVININLQYLKFSIELAKFLPWFSGFDVFVKNCQLFKERSMKIEFT